MVFIYVAIMLAYMVPGLMLARGMYAEQTRTIRKQPLVKALPPIPPKPPRPHYKLEEQLHIATPGKKCGLLSAQKTVSCDCSHREQYLKIKNGWIDYNEWTAKYGRLSDAEVEARNNKTTEPSIKMLPIYTAVPLWPLVGAGMFIKGGAKNIPDYRAIERMEAEEAQAIESKLKEIS